MNPKIIRARLTHKLRIQSLRAVVVALGIGMGIVWLAHTVIPAKLEPVDDALQIDHNNAVVVLQGSDEIEQHFATNSETIAGLSFYIVASSSPTGQLLFQLYDGPTRIVSQTLKLTPSNMPGTFMVSFAIVKPVNPQALTFTLTYLGPSSIVLGGTSWDSYPPGKFTINHGDQPGDLSFIVYTYPTVERLVAGGLDAVRLYMEPLGLVIPVWLASSLFVWAILSTNARIRAVPKAVTLTAALSCSLLIVPLLLLACTALRLPFTCWIIVGACLFMGIGRWSGKPVAAILPNRRVIVAGLSLLVMAGFVFIIQLGLIDRLAFPSYVDSIHHTEISNQIVASGQVPTYFLDTHTPFLYHFGIHALTASIVLFGGGRMSSATVLLILGPFLLMIFALGLYSVTRLLGGDHWLGLCIMIVATFAMNMPTHLLDWGKYPLLFALATWPGVFALVIIAFYSPHATSCIPRIVAGFLMAGNVLAHTRALFVWAIILVGLALVLLFFYKKSVRHTIASLGPLMVGLLLVVGLWLIPVWWQWHEQGQHAASLDSSSETTNALTGRVPLFGPQESVWIALLCLGFLFTWRGNLGIKALLTISIVAIAGLSLLPVPFFPGGSAFDPQFVQAAVTIPIITGLSILGKRLQAWTEQHLIPRWVVPLIVAALAVYGLTGRQSAPGLCCQLASHDDLTVLTWLKNNVPPDAHIGIAGTRRPDGQAVGVDAGYWIHALTGRAITIPSLLYGFTDAASQLAITQHAIDVDSAIRGGHNLCNLGINYVYMGQSLESFNPVSLANNPNLALRYRQGASAVFEVKGC